MTKRLLVAVLAAAVIAGAASGVFAASFSDTAGTKYENAVGVLSSLGILNGFPDGTFRPGATITRAQFAAVAVRALGLDDAASQSKGPTKFTDVPGTHWASGYINVAADQALVIMGYPDGTYRPEAPVKYSESLAILVRLLGYQPVVTGSWPTNYIVKAAELGMSRGLTFLADDPAPRGAVALMVENSLGIGMMVQTSAGGVVQYQVTDDTLVDRLGYEAHQGQVTCVPAEFGAESGDGAAVIGGLVWPLAEGLDIDDQLGLVVRFWCDGDGRVVYAKTLTPAADVIEGQIGHITDSGLQVVIGGRTFTPAVPAYLCVWNLTSFKPVWVADNDPRFEGADATLVLDAAGKITFMVVTQFDGSVVVSDVNDRFERFDAWDAVGAEARFDLTDYAASRFVKGGAEVVLGGVDELDVGHYFEVSFGGDDYLYVELYDDKVAGEVDAVAIDADDNLVVTVDGDDYALDSDGTLSVDDNATVEAATEEGMEDFLGREATLYLDRDGDARHIVGDFEAAEATAFCGAIKTQFYKMAAPEPGEEDHFYVRLFRPNGATERYEITAETYFEALTNVNYGTLSIEGAGYANDAALPALNAGITVGTFVDCELNDDGTLAALTEHEFDDDSVGWNLMEADIDADRDLLLHWRAAADILIIDVGEWEVIPWSTFVQISITTPPVDQTRMDHNGDATLETIIFDSTGHFVDYGAAAEGVGIVLAREVTAEGTAVEVLVEDDEQTYLVASVVPGARAGGNEGASTGNWSDIDAGDLVTFESTGDEFTDLTERLALDFSGLYSYWVEDYAEADGIITIRDAADPEGAGTTDLLLDEDWVVYDVTGDPEQVDEVSEDDVIQAFDLDGDGLVEVIKIIE